MRPPVRRWILLSVGILAVILGTVGVFVPLLPTTPFLMLAAACFLRSSDRMHHWLLTHPVFGKYVRNYREHHAITLPAKLVSLVLLWGTILYSATSIVESLFVRILLGLIAVGVTIHLLTLKTLTRAMLAAEEEEAPEARPGGQIVHGMEDDGQ